jgi:RNA polymerase sigma-70 factor, ECF subfamily
MILESDEGHRTPRKEKNSSPDRSAQQGARYGASGGASACGSAQSDPARFEALYELHFDRVYGFVAGRVHDRVTAEDVTSEAFYKALANLKAYEWRGVPFAAWLLRIAANAIVDRSERASREHSLPDDLPDPGVHLDIRAVEQRARLFRLVSQLPEMQQRVVHERFVDQRSIREIAERLGKSEGA